MAGAQLLGLQDEAEVVCGEALTHEVGPMADDHVNALGLQRTGAVDDVPEHGFAGNRVENLGQRRAHAGALACGEDDDIEGHERTLPSLWITGDAGKEKG